jgi:hypothetical protein
MRTDSCIASTRVERGARVRALALGTALAIVACAGPEPRYEPEPQGVCDTLADEFEAITAERDRGVVRGAQVDAANRAFAGATPESEPLLRSRLEAIDFVYGRPEWTPAAVARFVRNNCIVSSTGQPRLYLP